MFKDFQRHIQQYLLIGITFLLVACGRPIYSEEDLDKQSARELFAHSQVALSHQDYINAVRYLESLVSRFPFSLYSKQAQLHLIYAYDQSQNYELAEATAASFVQQYPRDRYAEYAYYIKGLIEMQKDRTWTQKKLGLSPALQDGVALEHAFRDFGTFLRYYPHSQYASDAYFRMIYIRNQLAKRENLAGEYYLKKKAYPAALERAQYVVQHFPGSPEVVPALQIMSKASQKLGKEAEVKSIQSVLKLAKEKS